MEFGRRLVWNCMSTGPYHRLIVASPFRTEFSTFYGESTAESYRKWYREVSATFEEGRRTTPAKMLERVADLKVLNYTAGFR